MFAKNNLSPDVVPLTSAPDVARIGLANLGQGPTIVSNVLADIGNPLVSIELRRQRVAYQSKFLDNFYGPA